MRLLSNKITLLFVAVFLMACEQDIPVFVFQPNHVAFETPVGFPNPDIPADNPLTEEGIALGKKLFHDPILSGDNTQACASCHLQSSGFSDPSQFSEGISGAFGDRNASTIINAAWNTANFWDGRAITLEDQALGPVTNPIEMNSPSWEQVIEELKATTDYPELFRAAFNTSDFDSIHVAKAIAQFERTLISGNSRFDKISRHEQAYTASELRGFEIYTTEKADCFHCHPRFLFTDNDFHNNGLDDESDLKDARYSVTGEILDKGKFKSPTLRNIALSAPYMHDGRFATLEEVVEHYNSGGKESSTIDPLMKHVGTGLGLTSQEKEDLVNFLQTLTDTAFISNPIFQP
jgi:cytochrome c peroxidase